MLPTTTFTKAEALAHGVSEYDWRVLVRDRGVRRLVAGVYADAASPDTMQLRLSAVSRVLPDGVVVARRSASWVLGVDALDPRGYPATPPVEVLATEPALRLRRGLVTSFSADDLRDDDVVTIDGVRLTSPLRTACDLGRFVPRPQALAAIDSFLHAGLVTPEQLANETPRWRRRRGVRQLEELARIADPLCESPGESRMRLRAIDAGFPAPECQIPIHDLTGHVRYRLDLGYRDRRIGMEYDGEDFHGPERAEADARRRDWITRRGWRLAVFGRDAIYGDSREFEDALRRLWSG
jgi:hypothetical protein